jgi:hypothetical protein
MSTLMAVSDHLDDPPPRLAEALFLGDLLNYT